MKNSGWIILDKPSGMSSRAAGGRIARMLGIKKFGHLGTLDPMASGVLPIAFFEATKMIPYLEEAPQKEYEFSVQWGTCTDTDDITGRVLEQNDMAPTHAQIAAAIPKLIGEIDQVPPAYSAVHIDGVRAYKLAVAGKPVEIPPRRVRIYNLEYLGENNFKVQCGAGTYVRSLARDIGALAGGFLATCTAIRRTRTHDFYIKDAVSLDFLENLYNNAPQSVQDYLMPTDFGLDDILVAELNGYDAASFQNGGFIQSNGNGLRRVYNDSKLIGIGEIKDNLLRPLRIIKQ
ncbi:MAG: tRNA pseudouridine(55) synthase TruB [Alphaproteobacteria bacterium]|nr:tRNA pseudouridine(55) synthase TruB [Alphaproteobacteria bacterium]